MVRHLLAALLATGASTMGRKPQPERPSFCSAAVERRVEPGTYEFSVRCRSNVAGWIMVERAREKVRSRQAELAGLRDGECSQDWSEGAVRFEDLKDTAGYAWAHGFAFTTRCRLRAPATASSGPDASPR